MNDFINMSCPACGGQLQVKKDMQKYFCMHCGTELLLKQDSAGVFNTIQARDLQASAKLKEMQFSKGAIDLLKSEIKEHEEQIKSIRATFLDFSANINDAANFISPRYLDDYEKEKKLPFHLWIERINHKKDWNTYIEKNIPGYNTAEELIEFSQFLQRPKYKKYKDIIPILGILEPLPDIARELKEKKIQLKNLLDQAINNQ